MVEKLTLGEFDHVVEDYKGRKLSELNDAERSRQMAERARDEAQKQTAVLQQELATTRAELDRVKGELAQRKEDWNASVGRIQQQLEQREASIKAGEDDLKARQQTLNDSEGRNRHQWTLVKEAVDNLKALVTKHLTDSSKAVTDLLATLPAGTDQQPS